MADLRPSIDVPFTVFGVAATVRLPDSSLSFPATVTELPSRPAEFPPEGAADFTITEQTRRFAVRRSEIASVPRGTAIVIGPATFLVDRVEFQDDVETRVVARPGQFWEG
jgi:hypothetical protein